MRRCTGSDAAKRRCSARVHACTNVGVGELSWEIQTLARDVAVLRAELEQYRTELREVLDQFLEERSCVQVEPCSFRLRKWMDNPAGSPLSGAPPPQPGCIDSGHCHRGG